MRWIVMHRASHPPAQRAKVAAFLDPTARAVDADEEILRLRAQPLPPTDCASHSA